MPADIDAFKELCKEKIFILIEDAALCCAGSSYKGNKIGSHSGLVCFSFHPRKVITTVTVVCYNKWPKRLEINKTFAPTCYEKTTVSVMKPIK